MFDTLLTGNGSGITSMSYPASATCEDPFAVCRAYTIDKTSNLLPTYVP